MQKTIIECALNGPWTRAAQPLIPISVAECIADGVACAKAGASIIHVHPYDEATGKQRDEWEIYARIIEGIRNQVDVPVYPTIPFSHTSERTLSAQQRFAATAALAQRGLLELAAVDPGSVNFTFANGGAGFVYSNPEADIEYGLNLAASYGFIPCYAIYEPGFLRAGASLHARHVNAPNPLYRFMFSSEFLFGFPPVEYGLEALLRLRDECAPNASWMSSGLGVDITPLIAMTVASGGHLRVGLEDAPLGSTRRNLEWVELAVRAVETHGGKVATVPEMRALLGIPASKVSSADR
ncbi:MAG: 3-keto-5-aminohexanoate cleavage protein [Gammaproteobacteria bacterium]|nr:3-keto-5-aminohexanoate cleavage protein [Gammaproteobacteria bacterium]